MQCMNSTVYIYVTYIEEAKRRSTMNLQKIDCKINMYMY